MGKLRIEIGNILETTIIAGAQSHRPQGGYGPGTCGAIEAVVITLHQYASSFSKVQYNLRKSLDALQNLQIPQKFQI